VELRKRIEKEIRRLLDRRGLGDCYGAINPDYPKLRAFQPIKFLNELLPYIESLNLVQLDENQTPPDVGTRDFPIANALDIRTGYKDANFRG